MALERPRVYILLAWHESIICVLDMLLCQVSETQEKTVQDEVVDENPPSTFAQRNACIYFGWSQSSLEWSFIASAVGYSRYQ